MSRTVPAGSEQADGLEALVRGVRRNVPGVGVLIAGPEIGTAWCDAVAAAVRAHLAATLDAAREDLARILAVHERYFDLDGKPGADDTCPEPEDVWRYDRDFRLAAHLTPEAKP